MSIGQLYFAMVDIGEPYDDGIHSREDLEVFNLKITQSESEFARAELEVINPKEGLLSPARKQRIYISCEVTPGGLKQLLFSGRITGYPTDLAAEFVTLEYLAQPEDWAAVQAAFLDTLKVMPYYHELFTPQENRNNPEEILAARASLIHWHRATNAIALSDILQGSDTIVIDEDYFFDSLQTSIGDPPLKQVNLNIEVQWQQIGVGEVNCAEKIRLEFTNSAIATPQINTLTPLAFEDGWKGARIPSGYEIIESVLTPIADGFGLAQADLRSGTAVVTGANYPTANGSTPPTREVTVPRVWYIGRLKLLAVYEQKRREVLTAIVDTAIQEYSLKSDASEDLFLRIEDPVSSINGEVLDPTQPSFFYDTVMSQLTTYGEEAVQHGLLRARARLAKSFRTVEMSVEVKLDDILDITCDHSIHLLDDRLPGQSVSGKVVGYQMEVDGDTGLQIGRVTIASSIGTGDDSTGSGTELEEKIYDTEIGLTMASSVFYDITVPPSIDIPIDVSQMETDDEYLIDNVIVVDDGESQNTNFVIQTLPDVYLQDHRTSLTIDLKSMNPEKELFAEIALTMGTLTFPKQVDLGFDVDFLLTDSGVPLLQGNGSQILV